MRVLPIALLMVVALVAARQASASPEQWRWEWPNTDFSRGAVPFDEIFSGGPPKDGIPPIDAPRFQTVAEVADGLAPTEPVIAVVIGETARAYPLRILMWHEIVNDVVADVPIAVTFCPLCNSSVVFDRRLDDRVLDFGTTGKLRYSDLVMYDRQTESWWQQFLGEAIVGELTGKRLRMLPARVESFAKFRERHRDHADVAVLVPTDPSMRSYGNTPYHGYDGRDWPFLYKGAFEDPVAPLSRVVVVEDEAWALALLRAERRIETDDLVITWEPGQNSALDTIAIAEGRDIGNVVVRRRTEDGLVDAVHDVSFAFAFRAFHPEGTLHAPK